MSVSELVQVLAAQGVELWFEGDRLRFRAPKGALTAEQRADLRARKADVLTHLRAKAVRSMTTCPLSYSQRSLWFEYQSDPQSAAYNVGFAARVLSAIDAGALCQALQALVDRHATLRTAYPLVDFLPVQRVAGYLPIDVEMCSVAGLSEPDLQRRVAADYARPFNLEEGHVFRGCLYSQSATDHVLLLVVHHIAADGWSILQLIDEFRELYAEATDGLAVTTARPAIEYTDFTRWQADLLAGPEGQRLADIWRRQLAPPRAQISLPSHRPRSERRSSRGSTHALELDLSLSHAARQLARDEGVTLFVVLLAVFKIFLYRYSGTDDIIVGTPTFGRTRPQFARIIGDFVNTVALRSRLDAALTFRELLAQLRRTVLDALEAQDYPFPLVVEQVQPERDATRSPLFDTFFVMQRFDQLRELDSVLLPGSSSPAIDFGGLKLAHYPLDQQEGQFDLTLQVVDRVGALAMQLKYRREQFDPSAITNIADQLKSLLAGAIEDPARSISSLAAAAMASPAAGGRATVVMPTGGDSIAELIARLGALDIRVAVDNNRLKVSAPKGALDAGIKSMIADRREELIDALRSPGPGQDIERIPSVPRLGPTRASFAQQRLWFLDRVDPGRSHYNIGVQARVRGLLDVTKLRQSFDDLVGRHEALHSRIVERDGAPWVERLIDAHAPVEWIDLSDVESGQREAEGMLRLTAELQRPFDLGKGPLCRFLIVRLDADHHLIAISVHHAASDGWSLAIALGEVLESYRALVEGQPGQQFPLRLQYADYAVWEREQFRTGRSEDHLNYWRRQLAGAPLMLELPRDRPRPLSQTFKGNRLFRKLSQSLLDGIKDGCRQHNATLFMWLMAVWQVLIHRYSGQDDIVVGTPVANRVVPELEGVIGCLVNNVAIRGRLDGNPRFSSFLAQIRKSTLDAFDHCQLPFDLLVEALNPVRSADHAPIFQVQLTLMSYPLRLSAPAGLTVELLASHTGGSRLDLSVETIERDGGLHVMYEFATDLFDEVTIQRLHQHFERLLQATVESSNSGVLDLPFLTHEDERLLLQEWNDTAIPHDRGRCVHHLLEATAQSMPTAIAVTAGADTLTYRELDERANRLAHLVQLLGGGPDVLVAICLDRTVDMPIAMAAVLKAGAAYVPLDPTHPPDRLRYAIEDAGVACILTSSRFAELFSGIEPPLVLLDQVANDLSAFPSGRPQTSCGPLNLAYVIYTSGSTGKPKGVQIEHRNVVSFLEAMRREPGMQAHDVLLAVTTLSFDIAGLEMWLPMMVGARIVVASRTDVLDGQRLVSLMRQHGVTALQATPSTWRLLIEAGWTGEPALKALCGGEALQRDLAHALVPRVAELWNMYGPTETTIWSTVGRIVDPNTTTIGRPIANTRVYVLEAGGTPAPVGVPGELCIGGEGVARGYHRRRELTAEKFVTITLPGDCSDRVYRSGDVARFRADGQLEFIGRRDAQVKIRGYRIELGEIEAALAAHDGIIACVVVVRDDLAGDQRLVGYVVAEDGDFDAAALRTHLRRRLPEYMVPNALVQLAALPLTPNGKVDRNALPPPEMTGTEAKETTTISDATLTPVQRRVLGVWRNVLGLDRIGLHSNFFDMGGHSLLLVKLQAALKREFDQDIPLVQLFQSTTVAAQADRLSAPLASTGALERARARALKQVHD